MKRIQAVIGIAFAFVVVLVGAGPVSAGTSGTWQQSWYAEYDEWTDLSSISCPSETSCVTVGDREPGFDYALIVRFKGGQWGTESPDIPDSDLFGVSCVSGRVCMAVGQVSGDALSVRWDGTQWKRTSLPNPSSIALLGIRCVNRTFCMAVGEALGQSPIGYRWNGASWSLAVPPKPVNDPEAVLVNVACPSATTCFAVGNAKDQHGLQSGFIERWDGTAWTIQVQDLSVIPRGVSCLNATSCVAVGQGILRWDGSTWTKEATTLDLRDVSCPQQDFCEAVGYHHDGLSSQPFALKWNGSRWKEQAVGGIGDALRHISCTSSIWCMAAGNHFRSDMALYSDPLVEHYAA